MANAQSARAWMMAQLKGDEAGIAKHFVAVSTNAVEVTKITYGINLDTVGVAGIDYLDSADVFADKASAITEYDTRLGVQK